MFGYATNEWDTETLHPYSHYLANKLSEEMAIRRKNGSIPWLRPDCKTQVIVEYRNDSGKLVPLRVYNILISTQHSPEVSNETINEVLTEQIIKTVIPAAMLQDTIIVINPSGKFDVGGPAADAGLTGRKIIVDTYGGWGAHGGGAFSGKDYTKVDRSGAYAARWVALSLVKAGLCRRCLFQVSYAIGVAKPLSLYIDSYGTSTKSVDELLEIVNKNFDLRPGVIVKDLDLRRPIFAATAKYGHFGRPGFSWEVPKKLEY